MRVPIVPRYDMAKPLYKHLQATSGVRGSEREWTCAAQLWLPWARRSVANQGLVLLLCLDILALYRQASLVDSWVDWGGSGGTRCMQAEATGPAASSGSGRAR